MKTGTYGYSSSVTIAEYEREVKTGYSGDRLGAEALNNYRKNRENGSPADDPGPFPTASPNDFSFEINYQRGLDWTGANRIPTYYYLKYREGGCNQTMDGRKR